MKCLGMGAMSQGNEQMILWRSVHADWRMQADGVSAGKGQGGEPAATAYRHSYPAAGTQAARAEMT